MAGITSASIKTSGVLALGFSALLIFSSCQQVFPDGRFVSPQGVSIEALLPEDLFMLAKAGTREQAQIDNLRQLNGFFPNDPLGLLVREFNRGVREGGGLEQLGLDYDRDLLPILNEKSELYLALAPGEGNSLENVRGVMALTVGDPAALDRLLELQLTKGSLVRRQHLGRNYYQVGEQESTENPDLNGKAYLVRLADVLLLTNDEQLLTRGIDSGVDKSLSVSSPLIDNAAYQRALKDHRPAVFLLYGDFSRLLDFMKEAEVDGQSLAGGVEMAGLKQSGLDSIESELVTVNVEKDGLRLVVKVVAREGADLREVAGQISKSYLSERIPAKEVILYSEGYDFSQSYRKFAELAAQDSELQQGLSEMETALQGMGIDFEQDILTFLDRGYAFVLEDTDSVFPSLAFYIDAAGNVAGAEKTMRLVHQGLTALLEEAKVETPELSMIITNEEVAADRLWKFSLNLDMLLAGQDSSLVRKLSGQKVEFYYGLLVDQTLVFALKPDLAAQYGQAPFVRDSAEFKQALSYLKGASYGVSYLAPAQFFVYLDRLVELAKADGTPVAAFADYELVKSYLRPLKSLSLASHGVEKEQTIVEVFLHIGK